MNHQYTDDIRISASLVLYKPDFDALGQTLRALECAGREVLRQYSARLTLTLVDNSDDPSWSEGVAAWLNDRAAYLSAWTVSLLCSTGNIGYGQGNNLVIEQAESDYHIVINPDLFVAPDSLIQALRFMKENPDVGLLVPAVFGNDGTRHYLCKRNPTLFVLFLRSFATAFIRVRFKSELDRFEMRDRNYDELIEGVEFPSGCFMFFRTRYLKQVGGFDPRYFMYFEDADIGRRLLQIARIVYVPDVKVVHLWERGTHNSLRLRYETIKSALIYWRKFAFFKDESSRPETSLLPLSDWEQHPIPTKPVKRILLIVVYYLPSIMSSAKLMGDLACEFHRLGYEVLVAAPDSSIRKDCEVTEEAGIKVLRVKTGEIRSAPQLIRAWREIRLSSLLWRKGKTYFLHHPCDLIVYYSPTIFFGGLVARLKRRYRCSSYLILRDIFPQWAVDMGLLRRGSLAYRFFKHKEKLNYDAATVIGVQSPANRDYFLERGLDRKYRLEVLYNWAATSGNRRSGRGEYRRRLGLEGKVVFFYGGNIGLAQDMDNIFRLAERLQDDPRAHFLLVGEGSELPRLRTLVTEKNLTNVSFHPSVDQEVYLDMLSDFDVGLISLDGGLRTQNFPGKMLSYMDQAKPILASINPGNDLSDFLVKHDAGLVCINGDDDRFESLARRLLEDEGLRNRLGRNARSMLEDWFSVKRAARQILSHVEGAR
ncbi:MAG: glycosyltransferase [Smithella sp.]|nr:glycosyltransferase [Smithella sp.]